MKAISNCVQRLEGRFALRLIRDFVRDPPDRRRMVVSTMGQRLNLETSECTRYLTPDGCLTELVDLDGAREDITDEELARSSTSNRRAEGLGIPYTLGHAEHP